MRKRYFFIGAMLTFIIGALPSRPALAKKDKKMVSDDISNMIIEGENRLKVSGEIPPIEWLPEVYKDLPDLLRDNTLISALNPPDLKRPPLSLPKYGLTNKTATPWLASVLEPPVLTLYIKPGEHPKKVDWKFLVKDSQGKSFYEIKTKGGLPEKIKWDGFNQKNRPLHVGFDYSYSLSIIDEAGNPQRYAGKPFRVNAFRYKRGGEIIASFNPESLFIDQSSIKLSEEGTNYLTETKDFFRLRQHGNILVTVYESDQKFGTARGNLIRNYLLKSLDFAPEQVTLKVSSKNQGEGYRHVDIIAK